MGVGVGVGVGGGGGGGVGWVGWGWGGGVGGPSIHLSEGLTYQGRRSRDPDRDPWRSVDRVEERESAHTRATIWTGKKSL